MCRSCNSSKSNKDLLAWWWGKMDGFPPLLLIRRNLKVVLAWSHDAGLLDIPREEIRELPCEFGAVPLRYPAPTELRLWVVEPPDVKLREVEVVVLIGASGSLC